MYLRWGGAEGRDDVEVEQRVAPVQRNIVDMEGVEVKLNWDPSVFVAEHMSMKVSPRWNPQAGWFKKDVVQPMDTLAEFTPYLSSSAMCGPFEQRGGGVCGPRAGPTPAPAVVIFAYGGGM